MKVLLAFFVLGLCGKFRSFGTTSIILIPAQSVLSSRVVKRSKDLRQQVLGELNEFRSKYAEAAQVSNMNELSYDLDLEREVSKYSSCSLDKPARRWLQSQLTYRLRDKQFESDFVSYTIQHRDNTTQLKRYFGYEDYFWGVLHAPASKVGCVRYSSPCIGIINDIPMSPPVIFTKLKSITASGFCLFGPIMKYTRDDISYGEPGSNCRGEHTEGGLCKASN
ncbi:hypothetical protein GCK72_012532 [Caenorhabditis remanei]|uniref:Uncharacterized protein n=1 Tax=Caenorhabditis remanei TaxID=31234 RepID=A0A6A5GNT2_CAERE|nr:hypothetical protein GCK72_012532 [Caenorhabditis remanei]KAF1756079.1 hypothetical protein GCK72_012532 [Caenorhabditis remanei]